MTDAAPAQEPLDAERWQKLQALQAATGNNFLVEIIDLFSNETPDRLSGIRAAMAAGDGATAERLAHSLKGSSSNIGAPHMVTLAAKLEKLFGQGIFEDVEDLLAQVEAEYGRVCKALEAYRP